MGSINIDFIEKDNTTQSDYLYSDVHLDLTNDYKIRANYSKSEAQLVDIKVAYDIDAIKNSMNAIFSTNLGERLLIPEFGVNIKRFLFSPVSTGTARAIGELLNEAIERWEPRVEVQRLAVSPIIDDHRYDISLSFYIPSLKSNATFLGSILQGEGFTRG